MDYQRIFILLGLAVTAYMLVLAWNEDYGNQVDAPPAVEVTDSIPMNADLIPDAGDAELGALPAAAADEIPTVEAGELSKTAAQPVPNVASEAGRYVEIRTDVLELVVDRIGGDVVSASLRAYPRALGSAEPFVLVDPRNKYTLQSGLIGPNGTDTADGRPEFIATQTEYDLGANDDLRVALTHRQGEVVIRKIFEMQRSNYLVNMRYEIKNGSDAEWRGAVFGQIKRNDTPPHDSDVNSMGMQPYVGGATRSEDALFEKVEFDDLEDEEYRARIADGYIALVQHYFVTALIPLAESEHSYRARQLTGQNVFLFGVTSPMVAVAAGTEGVLGLDLYVGPKDQYRLAEIAPGLDLTIDYGFLWWLAQPLFYLLTFIQGYVVNWGLAIIMLTFVVKLLLYPLSAASFRSNAKLRKLQPKMARLKEQYGEDRQKFSQEMMALYQKEGANPLGGCLPLLLQMPVFLALYWVLMESVELRQAPFMLWIDDLSVKDPFFVLPILMGISMYFVTLMQPEPPDPMQAKIFKIMPVMFTFFFLWFPAGLVLYWLVNNVLSIMQQWWVTRQLDKET